MTIMIVDDHIDIRRILRQIISVGHTGELHFIECETGEEAVQQFELEQPDLVLMDIELKNMNGLDAAAYILQQYKHAKVLIVTSHDSPSIRKKASLLPIQGFVSKDDLSQVHQYISN